MTALLSLPNRPPPKLKNPKFWSPMFNDFLSKALVKDPEVRPNALDMMQVLSFIEHLRCNSIRLLNQHLDPPFSHK